MSQKKEFTAKEFLDQCRLDAAERIQTLYARSQSEKLKSSDQKSLKALGKIAKSISVFSRRLSHLNKLENLFTKNSPFHGLLEYRSFREIGINNKLLKKTVHGDDATAKEARRQIEDILKTLHRRNWGHAFDRNSRFPISGCVSSGHQP